MSEPRHQPVTVRCACGRDVPWGKFDEHVRRAMGRDLLKDFKAAVRAIREERT